MDFLGFFTYFGFISTDIKYENINFNENIDYCTNIIHDPRKEDEFLKNCDLEETNTYIMMIKNGKYK